MIAPFSGARGREDAPEIKVGGSYYQNKIQLARKVLRQYQQELVESSFLYREAVENWLKAKR